MPSTTWNEATDLPKGAPVHLAMSPICWEKEEGGGAAMYVDAAAIETSTPLMPYPPTEAEAHLIGSLVRQEMVTPLSTGRT